MKVLGQTSVFQLIHLSCSSIVEAADEDPSKQPDDECEADHAPAEPGHDRHQRLRLVADREVAGDGARDVAGKGAVDRLYYFVVNKSLNYENQE